MNATARHVATVSETVTPRYLTTTTVAAYLSKTPEAVKMMVKRAQIPCVRVGKSLRFDRVEIDRWMLGLRDRRKAQ